MTVALTLTFSWTKAAMQANTSSLLKQSIANDNMGTIHRASPEVYDEALVTDDAPIGKAQMGPVL